MSVVGDSRVQYHRKVKGKHRSSLRIGKYEMVFSRRQIMSFEQKMSVIGVPRLSIALHSLVTVDARHERPSIRTCNPISNYISSCVISHFATDAHTPVNVKVVLALTVVVQLMDWFRNRGSRGNISSTWVSLIH